MVSNSDGKVIAADLPQFHSMLNNLKTYLGESISGVTNLQKTISDSATSREHGLSFLEMKCHLFLEYLINITYSMLLKLDGKPISGEACIEHLVEIRTVLSKIKPIEKKLKYQVDKLVKMSSDNGQASEQNALSYKPNFENMVGKDEGEEEEEEEEEDKSAVYVPPKLTAVPYEGDKLSREERKLEKARKRNLNSNLLADIREEFGDEPEEISDGRNRSMQRKMKEREDERQKYEEDNLVRLTMTKKDKLMKRKMSMIDEVVKIGKYTGGDDEDSDDEIDHEPSSKKSKKFGGGKGKFKKRMQRKRK